MEDHSFEARLNFLSSHVLSFPVAYSKRISETVRSLSSDSTTRDDFIRRHFGKLSPMAKEIVLLWLFPWKDSIRENWTTKNHRQMPQSLQQAVLTMLMIRKKAGNNLSRVPKVLLVYLFSFFNKPSFIVKTGFLKREGSEPN